MLQNTFIHLRGIGPKKERFLWKNGILTWDDYLQAYPSQESLFDNEIRESAAEEIAASKEAFKSGDIDFFAERLPTREHFRIALAVPEQTAFLDIETTGLSFYYDKITLVGYAINGAYHCHIQGTNKREALAALKDAKCLVTFNGSNFDLKFIAQEFPELKLPKAHIDLRYFARSVGLSGGQKEIEKKIDITRTSEIADVSGEQAPLLWHEYRMGNLQSAKQLITYNAADIRGMQKIFAHTLRAQQPFPPQISKVNLSPSVQHTLGKVSFAKSRKSKIKNRVFVPRYQKKRGPKITYSELLTDTAFSTLRVVGIDLTGSERRPSGWAMIDGDHAHTKLLSTDAELLAETISFAPNLVSIDSPLSLPSGRTKVTDDDPRRDEIGIMRQCERTLKARGVNVYPSLIPSMQQLTARGIRLANRFRALGVPVIESYPGAAQDIMDIPRKRAGLHLLAKGLSDFGIHGEFESNGVSHDELDAITSAAVGLFFWSGRFEALGNEDEDFLIIPDLETSPSEWRNRCVIGFSGPISVGKTTSGEHLRSEGFAYGRYSQVLSKILAKQGIKETRAALQQLGEEINKRPGQRWLSRKLAATLSKSNLIVIDGLRFPEDHATLIETFGPAFTHIHIDASRETRLKRFRNIRTRNRATDFEQAEQHPVEKKIPYLRKLAHQQINNDKGKSTLTRRLNRLIKGNILPRGGISRCR